MAGHSKFKNIQHRKGAQDAKRSKQFIKISREITTAARMGSPDPTTNPRLRAALTNARVMNMPRERWEKAIKVATGEGGGENYEEIRYEGYGPGGVAIIVDALTDNRNRTAPEMRTAFGKYGGALGESNSVAYMFNRLGQITYPASIGSNDAVFEAAVEAGAENVESDTETHIITCAFDDFAAVRDALETKFSTAQSAKLIWQPTITSAPNEEQLAQVLKLIDVLEDNDDVQTVTANFDVSEEVLERALVA